MQKLTEKEITDLTVNEKLIVELLDVLDNFERAFSSEYNTDTNIGYKLIYKQLLNILTNAGVEKIDTNIKDTFDTDIHNAVSVVRLPYFRDNEVIYINKNGYMLNGKIIRYADVTVNKLSY